MEEKILEFKQVSFTYPEGEQALRQVSLKVGKGERIAVLGNNGAGKSSFFLVCNGVLKPSEGAICYCGREMTDKKADVLWLRSHVGIIFQDADSQIIASTVEGEVSFGPMNLGLGREQVAERVGKALASMDLLPFRKRAPQYLSGGEKKRVTIADILAMQPEMMLLDEPEASLDAGNCELLEETLDKLSKAGITLMVSTHDVDFAYRFADRVLVFHQGEIIADGETLSVFEREETLRKAGLKQPVLFQMAKLLEPQAAEMSCFPRTVSEIKAIWTASPYRS